MLGEFMKVIDRDAKILNISHFDLDGAVCSILLRSVFNNVESVLLGQFQMEQFFNTKNLDGYDYIIMTDLCYDNDEFLNRSNVILLDHHSSAKKYHNVLNNKIVVESNSASHLVKTFLERMFKVSLECFDDLVYMTNDYDMWKWPDRYSKKSVFLNELFYYHKDNFLERFAYGDTRFTEDELVYLKKRIVDFKTYFAKLDIHYIEPINAAFVICNDYVNDVSQQLLYSDTYDITFCYIAKKKKMSIRTKRTDINLGTICKDNFNGGGHPQSAGISNIENLIELKKIIDGFIKIVVGCVNV